MSNRFHSKFHRQNHHTYSNPLNPDAGHDPIASTENPFKGDFIVNGAINCNAPLSSVAGYFYSNNTALCAVAATKGAHIYSSGNMGVYVYSAGIALSAYGVSQGANIYSTGKGINVFGGTDSIISYSPNKGITSTGLNTYAGSFYSNTRAITAFGNGYGVDVVSNFYGINAIGGTFGGNFYSASRGLSAYGGSVGVDIFSPSLATIIKSPKLAALLNSTNVALSTIGGGKSYFDGNVGIGVVFPQVKLTVNGAISSNNALYGNSIAVNNLGGYGNIEVGGVSGAYIDLKSPNSDDFDIRIITNGTTNAIQTSAGQNVIFDTNKVGIRTATPNEALTVFGNVSSNGVGTFNGILKIESPNSGSREGGQLTFMDPASTGAWEIDNYLNNFRIFRDKNSNIVHGFSILSSGNVGIATLSPITSEKLTVNGNTTIIGNISSSGNLIVSGQIFFSDGTVSAPAIANGGDTNNGIYFPDTDVLGFVTNGSERFRIDANGNFGINTLYPNEKLTVNGSISSTGGFSTSKPLSATGTYTVNSTDYSIILTAATTVTLPTPSQSLGRLLYFKNISSSAITSASTNVVSISGGATNQILSAGPGKWANLHCDGTYWQIMAGN